MPIRPALFAGTLLLAACTGSGTPGTDRGSVQAMSDEAFDQQLREALMRNPQVIIDALEAYRSELAAQAAAASEDVIRGALPGLIAGDYGVAIGADADEAEIVIVEFFDYHCGFCRRALDEVIGILDERAGTRLVLQELPVLRDESRSAALAALAAAELGTETYRQAHLAMMRHGGLLDDATVDDVLERAGVDAAAVRERLDGSDDALDERLEKSIELGREIGVAGTPFFIIFNPNTGALQLVEGYQAGTIEETVAEVLG